MTKDKSEQGDTRLINAAIALCRHYSLDELSATELRYCDGRVNEILAALDAVRPGWREAGR